MERNTVILYPCGICNLNCRYCTIDKNPILKDIDKELGKSFKGDYYFKQIKKYFPRKDQLRKMETWGGEPFIYIERIFPVLRQCIEYYPYFNTLFSSTNFSYDNWLIKFMSLMNVLAEYPYRHFDYFLQLSVDGPPYINDANRGENVTQKCIENFDKLISIFEQDQFPHNVTLHCAIKGTWDIDCIHKLNNKEKLIEFFQFYENNFMIKTEKFNNILFSTSIPNLAVPAPVTTQDGIIFAELVKKCHEIEIENSTNCYFKYYNNITPFSENSCTSPCNTYKEGSCGCGSGTRMVGFLPNNLISICHEGFTELINDYKLYANNREDINMTVNIDKNLQNNLLLSEEQYKLHEEKMSLYLDPNSTARFSSSVNLILALAMAREINIKYLQESEALKAAKYIFENAAFCIKCNYRETGSFTMETADIYKLLLNGALDYLTHEGAWFITNEYN